jgi:hypothetical protein
VSNAPSRGPRPTSVVSLVCRRRVRPAKPTGPRRSHVNDVNPQQRRVVHTRAAHKWRDARIDASVDRTDSPEAPLSVRGVYKSRRAARRIHGLAFIRREVFPPGPVAPCSSPTAGRGACFSCARSSPLRRRSRSRSGRRQSALIMANARYQRRSDSPARGCETRGAFPSRKRRSCHRDLGASLCTCLLRAARVALRVA